MSFEVRKQFRTAGGDFPDALAVLKFGFSNKIPVVFFLRTDARRNPCTCVWVLVRFQCKGPWAALENNVQIGHQCCMCLNLYWNQCRRVPVCFGNLKRIQYTETSKSTSCFNGFFSTGVLPLPECFWGFLAGCREWPSLALPTQSTPGKSRVRNCWGSVILLSFRCDPVLQPGVSFGVRPAVARARWELQEIRQKGDWDRIHLSFSHFCYWCIYHLPLTCHSADKWTTTTSFSSGHSQIVQRITIVFRILFQAVLHPISPFALSQQFPFLPKQWVSALVCAAFCRPSWLTCQTFSAPVTEHLQVHTSPEVIWNLSFSASQRGHKARAGDSLKLLFNF